MCVAVRGLTFLDGGGSRRKVGKGDSGTPSNASLRTTFGKMNFCLTQENNISKAAPQPDSRASMLRTRIQNVLHLSNNGKDLIRPSKKKNKCFSSGFLLKRERAGAFFFGTCYFLLFPIGSFLYTLLPSPKDKLEFLGQILIK